MRRSVIFFDVYELARGTGKSIGVYNYARNLLAGIANSDRDDFRVVVACNRLSLGDFSPPDPRNVISHAVVGDSAPTLLERLAWIFCRAAWTCGRHESDVYFSPRGFLPYGLRLRRPGIRTVVTVHDLIRFWYSEHFPDYFSSIEHRFVCAQLLRALRRADGVITISNAARDDLISRVPRPVHVIYNGVQFASSKPLSLPRRHILAMASDLPHKNLPTVLRSYEAYRASVSEPVEMVIVGCDDPRIPGVRAIRHATESELDELYGTARLFVFLSLIEGFGFPPLEAARVGTPVLCSDIPALRETAGEFAKFVSPLDVAGIARQMKALLHDLPQPRAEGLSSSSRFPWSTTVAGTLHAILDEESTISASHS